MNSRLRARRTRYCRPLAMMIAFGVAVNISPVLAKGQAWFFDQRSDYYGKHSMIMNDKGCKVTSERLGVTFITRAPAWHVYVINARKKEYLEVSGADWQKRFMGTKSRERLPLKFVRPGGKTKIAGVDVTQYYAYNPKLAQKYANSQPLSNGGKPYNTEMWVMPNLEPPRAVSELTEGIATTAMGYGFVLRVFEYTGKNQKMTSLDTLKAEHKAASDSEFNVPAGFRKAKDEMSLMIDEESGREAESLLFDGPPKGKSSGKMPPVGRFR